MENPSTPEVDTWKLLQSRKERLEEELRIKMKEQLQMGHQLRNAAVDPVDSFKGMGVHGHNGSHAQEEPTSMQQTAGMTEGGHTVPPVFIPGSRSSGNNSPLPIAAGNGPFRQEGVWTTVCSDELMRKCHSNAGTPDADFAPETMLRRLQHLVKQSGNSVAFRHLTDLNRGFVEEVTFEKLGEMVRRCSQGLINAGIGQYDKVCIVGSGSPAWVVAYLGVMGAGAIPCPLHIMDSDSLHIAAAMGCGARAVMTEDSHVANAFISALGRLPDLSLVISWEEKASGREVFADASAAHAGWMGAFFLEDLIETQAGPGVRREHEQRLKDIRPGSCASIVHTPGTASRAMLSHDNCSWTAQAVVTQIGITSSDNVLACLPIASATAQLLNVHVALVSGCTVTFPPLTLSGSSSWEEISVMAASSAVDADDYVQEEVLQLLTSVRPTIMVTTGSMWQRIASVLRAEVKSAPGGSTVAMKYTWALQKGIEAGKRLQGTASSDRSSEVGSKGMLWGVAKRVMFSKLWAKCGLDKCRYASGIGADCNYDALELLMSVGIPVMWMYGSAECSGLATLSSSSKSATPGLRKLPGFRVGYSGRALNGVGLTMRSRPSRNDEDSRWQAIFVKGRNVMMGYLNDPVGTQRVIEEDGTLATGDCGEMDWATRLLMIEAKEDALLMLSEGKKEVTATRIEEAMRRELPMLRNVVAVGDGLPFLVCLLTLETLPPSGDAHNTTESQLSIGAKKALERYGISCHTVEEARHDKALTTLIIEGVQRVNQSLGNRYAPVKRFFILSHDLQVTSDELTPTLQLRRKHIVDKFADVIEEIYDDSLPSDHEIRQTRTPQGKLHQAANAGLGTSKVASAAGVRSDGCSLAASNQAARIEARMTSLPQDFSSPNSVFSSLVEARDTPRSLEVLSGLGNDVLDEEQAALHARIEEAVLQVNTAISNVMVVGENHPFLSCLISLKTDSEEGEGRLHADAIAAAQIFGSTAQTVIEAKDDACFRAFLVDSIARVNRTMEEPVRRFAILLVDFLPAIVKREGPAALTAPMRVSVKRRFEKIIDSIYNTNAAPDGHELGTPASKFGGIVGFPLQLKSPGDLMGMRQAPEEFLGPNGDAMLQKPGQDPLATFSPGDGLRALADPVMRQRAHDISWNPPVHNQPPLVSDALNETARESRNIGLTLQNGSSTLHTLIPEFLATSTSSASVYGPGAGNGPLPVPSNGMPYYDSPQKLEQGTHKFNEELVQLVLDMDMADVLPRMQAFCAGVHSDVCRALDVHRDQVTVRAVTAGSVIVTLALASRDDDYRSPLSLVHMVVEQAADAHSVLRQGAYTHSLISVSHIMANAAAAHRKGLDSASEAPVRCGVGLVLQLDDKGRVLVFRVVPGTPAALTRSLCEGDIVIEVDGHSMAGAPADRIIEALQGDKGSMVRIAIMRGDIYHSVYMVRGTARDSLTPLMRTSLDPPIGFKQTSPRKDTSPSGLFSARNRLSMSTPASTVSSSAPTAESQRALQVVNMAFEGIKLVVWRRDGENIIEHDIPPNGSFPDEGTGCAELWPIPQGKDVCFSVMLGREASWRKSFCLPEFDKRSVRVRIEVDNEMSLLSVAPVLRKGKPIAGNVDAFSLRLNALPENICPHV